MRRGNLGRGFIVVLLVCAAFGGTTAGVHAAPDPSLAVIHLPYRSAAAWADPALERIDRTGLVVRRVGENVAYAGDVRTAHRRLMASPAHRRNVLSRTYGRIGIGVLNGGAAGVIVVEDFSN